MPSVVRGGTIINIAGLSPVDDPEYRYKMPAVFGKIEGSGNGIKTAIPNITDVALSLHRSPGEVNKFFGTELGAQTRYNADTDRAIVNGAHTDAVLQELMHRYIEKFVLCPNCGLPETEYKIKSSVVYHKCAACGAKEMVDMSHKLVNYILAEAKKDKVASASASAKKDKKAATADHETKKDDKKKKDKDKKEKKKGKEGGGSDEDNKKKKDKKDKDSSKRSSLSKKKDKVEVGNHGGGEDYIKNALLGKNSDSMNGDFVDNSNHHDDDDHHHNGDGGDDDVEEEEDDTSLAGVDDTGARILAIQATKAYLVKNPNPSVPELVEFVINQQMASALKSQERLYILIHGALSPSCFFKHKEIPKYAPVIAKLTSGSRIMERHLIAALEAFCLDKPKNFPVLIKQLYDEEALEEETILEWADEGRSDYTLEEVDEETRAVLRSEAEPVVVWLQEADSDDDGDDDELGSNEES